MWKFYGKAQFPHSFGWLARNFAETVPFHIRKFGEITAFYAVGLSMFLWKLSFLGISRFLTILQKTLLRQFATSVLSETSFSFSIKVFFYLDLVFFNRKDFIVCQKLLCVSNWDQQNEFSFLSVTKKCKSFFA